MSTKTKTFPVVTWEALVTSVYGSAPVQIGAHLLLHADRQISGNLGGGYLEHTVRNTLSTLQSIPPWWQKRIVLGNENDQCCGGIVDVVLVKVAEGLAPLYNREASRWYKKFGGQLKLLGGDGVTGVLGLPLPSGSENVSSPSWIAGNELFLVPAPQRQELWIFGAGHVGRAIASIADKLDFSIKVFDERREWLDPSEFPGNVELCIDWEIKKLPSPDMDTIVLILTYSHARDYALLRYFSSFNVKYLGVIASKSKAARFRHAAQREGWILSPALRMPMGLPGMGKSPAEIAISVIGELLQLRHKHFMNKDLKDEFRKHSA